MAIGRLCVSVGRAGKAEPHANYIVRQGKHASRLDGEKLEATASGNMPDWAIHDPLAFWRASDVHERKRGTTYRELTVALPRELPPAARIVLVQEFVHNEIGPVHAFQWAIHNPLALDGKDQPHVHVMLSERRRDTFQRGPDQYFRRHNSRFPERGGARKGFGIRAGQKLRSVERAADLKALRARWQDLVNRHLERACLAARVDMRSHRERGTGLVPEAKQTPGSWRGRGKLEVVAFRAVAAELAEAIKLVREIVPDPKAEIAALEAEIRDSGMQIDEALRMFERHAAQRDLAARGYTDSGQSWRAFPPSLQKGMDDFNQLPEIGRTDALTRLRSYLNADPDKISWFRAQLDTDAEAEHEVERPR